MFDLIASKHGLGSSFYETSSVFYSRGAESEYAFCVPFSMITNGPWIGELSRYHMD